MMASGLSNDIEPKSGAAAHLLETVVKDARYAVRSLRRSPGFTVTALLTLMLTIGAGVTALTFAHTLLWRSMDLPASGEIVVLGVVRRDPPGEWTRISYLDYQHIRSRTSTVDLVSHGSSGWFWVNCNRVARKVNGSFVSGDFFSVLGVKPAIGRFFTPEEDQVLDRDRVVVVSHRLWREAWNSPSALGDEIKLNGVAYTVIGVAPPGFRGVDPLPSDVYVPLMTMRELRGLECDMLTGPECSQNLQLIGRLRPGRTLLDVRAELSTLTPAHWRTPTDLKNGMDLTAFHPKGIWCAYGQLSIGQADDVIKLSTVGAVCLLLGCANLAGLLVARGTSRAREVAIRASLGVTPRRLFRQFMTEALVLSVCGGALGVILSIGLVRTLFSAFYERSDAGHVRHYDLSPDLFVLGASLALSVLAGLLFGVLPARRAIRLGVGGNLSGQLVSTSPPRAITRWLVGAQVATAVALISLSALLAVSVRRFVTSARFSPAHVAVLRVEPALSGSSYERQREVLLASTRALAELPDVIAVSPFSADFVLDGQSVKVGRAAGQGEAVLNAVRKDVGPGYFDALGIPIVSGRDFDMRDTVDSSRVAIIDERLAHSLWPNGDSLGSSLVVGATAARQVVGVVANALAPAAGESPPPHVYAPFWQGKYNAARFAVRVRGNPTAALPLLQQAVNRIDPDTPVSELFSMTGQLAVGRLRDARMVGVIAAYGAALAVLLGAIGIYGTLTTALARRTRELGVRMAVGAAPRDVIWLVVKEEMTVVLVGAVAGVALAWAGRGLVRSLLYGVPGGDVLMYAGAALVVIGVASIACLIPAVRATRIDMVTAVKSN